LCLASAQDRPSAASAGGDRHEVGELGRRHDGMSGDDARDHPNNRMTGALRVRVNVGFCVPILGAQREQNHVKAPLTEDNASPRR